MAGEGLIGVTKYSCHGDGNKQTISKIMIREESDSDKLR